MGCDESKKGTLIVDLLWWWGEAPGRLKVRKGPMCLIRTSRTQAQDEVVLADEPRDLGR